MTYAAEPGVFAAQNWISAIALDPAGNIVVAGGTRSSDFPTVNAVQASNAGGSVAFATTLAADGSRLISSTYLGGSGDDGALAVATDSQGNVILAGQTWSLDFPVPGGLQAPAGLGEAFSVKFAPVIPPSITDVVNGASFQPGIEAGSWVTIRGSNLANTNPGRTWHIRIHRAGLRDCLIPCRDVGFLLETGGEYTYALHRAADFAGPFRTVR